MATISEYLGDRDDVYVTCGRCSHFARFTAVQLKIRASSRTDVLRIEKRMRCSNCGEKRAFFTFTRPTSNVRALAYYKAK